MVAWHTTVIEPGKAFLLTPQPDGTHLTARRGAHQRSGFALPWWHM